jgi:hypothetical protein
MDTVWDDETQAIWSSIIAFWFGSQAFGKKWKPVKSVKS